MTTPLSTSSIAIPIVSLNLIKSYLLECDNHSPIICNIHRYPNCIFELIKSYFVPTEGNKISFFKGNKIKLHCDVVLSA